MVWAWSTIWPATPAPLLMHNTQYCHGMRDMRGSIRDMRGVMRDMRGGMRGKPATKSEAHSQRLKIDHNFG